MAIFSMKAVFGTPWGLFHVKISYLQNEISIQHSENQSSSNSD